jgi:2-methylcitrate dehydratase PrpD
MTMPLTIAQSMAVDALAMRAEALPPAVMDKARLCLVDYFGAAFEARALPWSQQAVAIARPVAEGAAAIALGRNLAPGEAAFANAVASHGLVREDMHTRSVSHLGVVVWPALLADLAQARRPISGADLLAAAVVGYEAGAALGRALMTAELARLFRPTGLVGPVAAAVAVGHLRGLSSEAMTSAISLAINCAAGLNQWPASGGSDMYFHAGFAARNALTCVDLAETGAFASRDIIEGEAGLFRAFARKPVDQSIRLFANGFEILDVFHKQAPACNYAQTPSQAALQARLKFEGNSSQVRAVHIAATQAALLYPGCDAIGPFSNVLAAKMSIRFGVAATIASGRIHADNYARLDDPEIARLIAVAELAEDPALTAMYPQRQPSTVTLTLDDGRVLAAALDDVLVAPPAMVRDRFVAAASEALGILEAQQLDHFIAALAETADAAPLNALQLPRHTKSD